MNMKKKSKPKSRSGWIMLAITLIIYVVTAVSDPALALSALAKGQDILKMIVPILLFVFFLMALLNTFIKPKMIAKHLGEGSGLKGVLTALGGGILTHGPGYVWFPILSELRSHGARDGLIITFFYARAIKLPWLPVMIGYFGIAFTLALSFYILLGAWIQGIIADKLTVKKID